MMKFRGVALGLVLVSTSALGAVAASPAPAAPSPGAQKCIGGIKNIQSGMQKLKSAVEAFDSLPSALKIQGVSSDLSKTVDSANSACKVAGQLDEMSSAALVTAAAELPGDVEASLSALDHKASAFKSLGLSGIVKSTVGDLQKSTDEFTGTLGSIVTEADKPAVDAAAAQIDRDFTKTLGTL
ncbi:cell wall mannoprotein 1 family protein [Streptomyces sp. NPDC058961]|uniref:cell wall mannoprotein 1 family protein n=1 Tax=Streptomyces sp. NPDC058961 TaxID=3346680 RepID=UPI00368E625F